MKVLLINPTYGGASGSGRHVELLERGLKENGYEVRVLSSKDTWYVPLPMLRSVSFVTALMLKGLGEGYDIVHLHNPKLAPLVLKFSKSVITIHGSLKEFAYKYSLLGKAFNLSVEKLLKRASVVTTVMMSEAESNGWVWIPNMIDVSAVDEINPAGEEVVMFVGRNDPLKNYRLFKSVVEKLRVQYKAFGVEEVVPWDVVISYMKSARCLFITSKWEGMPSVLLEAWAAKCPVIAGDIEAFKPFSDALLLSRLDVNSLVESFKSLDERREEIIERGRRYAESFDYKQVVKLYVDLYEKVLSTAR